MCIAGDIAWVKCNNFTLVSSTEPQSLTKKKKEKLTLH